MADLKIILKILFSLTILCLSHSKNTTANNTSSTNIRKKAFDDLEFWKPTKASEANKMPKYRRAYKHKGDKGKNSSDYWYDHSGNTGKYWKYNRGKDNLKDHLRNHKPKPATRYTKLYKFQDGEPDPKQLQEFIDYSIPTNTSQKLNGYDIRIHLRRIFKNFNNINVTFEVIGRTVEYNDIVLVKMAETIDNAKRHFRSQDGKYVDDVIEKKILFIVHNLNVMGSALLPCMNDQKEFSYLVFTYLKHIEQFDIFLIPIANPDGYNYVNKPMSQNQNFIKINIWNKNRSPQDGCPGVALDRNFDVSWQSNHTIGSCSDHYPGPRAFSEIETRAIRDVFHKYSHKIIAYINVHAGSYHYETYKGDAVLYPKGYIETQSGEDKYIDLKGEIDEAIGNASFKILSVTVDSLKNWYGTVHGTSVDYATTVYGIPFALEFVMQLYHTKTYEFDYDELHSHASLKEVWSRIIRAVFDFIAKSQKTSNEPS